MHKLYRSKTDKQLGGVCGGIAEILGIDSNIVRLVFFFAVIATAIVPGVLTYLLAWIIIPQKET